MDKDITNPLSSLGKVARWLVTAIVGVPVLILLEMFLGPPFVLLLIGAAIWGMFLPLRMRIRGRALPGRVLIRRIEAEGGTLIVDHPAPKYNAMQLWWTPDDLVAKSPYSQTSLDECMALLHEQHDGGLLHWDQWCWENYTKLDGGTAVFVPAWNASKKASTLASRHPKLAVVHAWTGVIPHRPREAQSEHTSRLRDRLGLLGCAVLVTIEYVVYASLVGWLMSFR